MFRSIYDYFLIKRSGLFDCHYYLHRYPDIRKADVNPIWHFVKNGWKERRNPSHDFHITFYLNTYQDVKQSGKNPLVHYIRHGMKEGRKPSPEESISKINQDNVSQKVIFVNKISNYSDGNGFESISEIISIIIPTKNAGSAFENLLQILSNQKGINTIELVIVDSGSTDDTLKIAEKYQAKIIRISPEDFSHSYARNLGAENASGDYLLFTVQDALPASDTWLYELMSVLKLNDVGAVSCAEEPRKDADLYYKISSGKHYEFLGVNDTDRIFSMPENSNHLSLRKNGHLSDIACLISAELFQKYQYRFGFAEDLDLGIRLIKDGVKIAFLGTTRIIHSHNRPPYYFFKRSYVDNLFLSEIFLDFPIRLIRFDNLIADITFSFNFLEDVVFRAISDLETPISTQFFVDTIKSHLESAHHYAYPEVMAIKDYPYMNQEYKQIINSLIKEAANNKIKSYYDGTLINALKLSSEPLFDHLLNSHNHIDEELVAEVKDCIFKTFSSLVGNNLSHWYSSASNIEKNALLDFHLSMCKGI